MKLIVVRHGESEMNNSGIIQGAMSKSNLTRLGRDQASKLAKKLANEKIDFAFVSPLDRAKQTAEIILENHEETKIKFADRLKEKDAGKYAGRSVGELGKAWRLSGLPFGEFQPEGGESWYQAGKRAVNFVKKIIDQYKDSDSIILIVGHGSVFTYLLMWADSFDVKKSNKEKYDHYHPSNTAVGVIEVDKTGKYTLISLNDISHLEK